MEYEAANLYVILKMNPAADSYKLQGFPTVL